jgi:hypothetical protein
MLLVMQRVFAKHKLHWAQKPFVVSAALGVVFLLISLGLNVKAGAYATKIAGNPVNDLILDNVRPMNVDYIFTDGIFLFYIVLTGILLIEPKYIPFVAKSLALFVLVRSGFIILTHIGPLPSQIAYQAGALFKDMSPGGDMFFSGHTGAPFLMALVFWQAPFLRVLFLLSSIGFGAAVLLGHLHYSIDVFAAFFITYGIFRMSQKFFVREYKFLG